MRLLLVTLIGLCVLGIVSKAGSLAAQQLSDAAKVPANWVEVREPNTWCGAKCLVLVSQGLGQECTLEKVLALCPEKNSDGLLSLADLAQVAGGLNLNTESLKCDSAWLDRPHPPAIALLNLEQNESQRSHFVVLTAAHPDKIEFVDPFYPTTTKSMKRDEFVSKWTGYVLVLSRQAGRAMIPDSLISIMLTLDVFLLIVLAIVLGRRLALRRLAVGTLALVGLAFVGCGAAEQELAQEKTLEFAHTNWDNGVIVRSNGSGNARHVFAFVNRSDKPVRIGGVASSCSCSVPTYPEEPIPPGGKGEIILNSDLSGREGIFDARALVVIAEPQEQQIPLVMRQFIAPATSLHPDRLDFGETQIGSPVRRTANLRIYLGPEEPTPSVRLENKNQAVTAKLLEPGKIVTESLEHRGYGSVRAYDVSFEVTLTPDATAGTSLSDSLSIQIERRDPISMLVKAVLVNSAFTVDRQVVLLGEMHPQRAVQESVAILVNGPGDAIDLEDYKVETPEGIVATLKVDPENHKLLNLRVDGSRHASGSIAGQLQLLHRGQPVYSIKCLGFLP